MHWSSNPEPKRKTDQYPGGSLNLERLFEARVRDSDEVLRADGKGALMASFKSALGGVQYTNQISCLRGRLRKGIIKLAQDMAAADNIEISPRTRDEMRLEALEDFSKLLVGHEIVAEVRAGQKLWRLRNCEKA